MIITHQLKTIFIHVHRTGGTSFANLLRQHVDDISDGLPQHSNARTVEDSFFSEYEDYNVVGFTRNPWERIFSWYSLLHRHAPLSLDREKARFEEFIETDLNADLHTQYFHFNSLDYFTTADGKLVTKQILQYEHHEKEVKELFRQFNLEVSHIPVMNKAKGKDYKRYYTETSYDSIARRCKRDIEYFNYCF